MNTFPPALFGLLLASTAVPQEFKVKVSAGAFARHVTHATATVDPDASVLAPPENSRVVCTVHHGDQTAPAQFELVKRSSGKHRARIHWVVAPMAANTTRDYTLRLTTTRASADAVFLARAGSGFTELLFRGRPVHRHVTAFDPGRRDETYKPFLHVYDLAGERLITKGPGGTYTHHRGVFLGWNRVSYGEDGRQKADFWHCKGVTIRHQHFLPATTNGPVFYETTAVNHWLDAAQLAVVADTRRVRTYPLDADQTMMDFVVTLRVLGEHPVRLDGDGHHAGFQFRAPQQVHKNQKQTRYVRPPAATKQKNDMWGSCPWTLCRFTLDGKPVTVMYLTASDNPKPAAMSTRPYGRFGSFFKTTLRPGQPLTLRYRILILREPEDRALTGDDLQCLYDDFANPLRASKNGAR